MKKALGIIFAILFLDQVIKIWIKTTMQIGETETVVPGLFQLLFIENRGMAFGMTLGGGMGKLALSLFRIIAVGIIGYYLWTLIKKKAPGLLIVCISMILAGAMGNILDSMFYGLMFDKGLHYDAVSQQYQSYYGVAHFSSPGYSSFLHGSVVDMFQFTANWPHWVPGVGGRPIFSAIFNLADASISIGVILLIIFNKRLFGKKQDENTSGEAA